MHFVVLFSFLHCMQLLAVLTLQAHLRFDLLLAVVEILKGFADGILHYLPNSAALPAQLVCLDLQTCREEVELQLRRINLQGHFIVCPVEQTSKETQSLKILSSIRVKDVPSDSAKLMR